MGTDQLPSRESLSLPLCAYLLTPPLHEWINTQAYGARAQGPLPIMAPPGGQVLEQGPAMLPSLQGKVLLSNETRSCVKRVTAGRRQRLGTCMTTPSGRLG